MKGWSGNAVKFGVASAVVTLLLNWIGNATASGDACHRSSPLGLLAFLVFLGLMGAAGFVTARGGGTIGAATMAGLVAAPGEAMYASTKHAAIAFTLGTLFDLRRSGVKRIHLSAVCPDGTTPSRARSRKAPSSSQPVSDGGADTVASERAKPSSWTSGRGPG